MFCFVWLCRRGGSLDIFFEFDIECFFDDFDCVSAYILTKCVSFFKGFEVFEWDACVFSEFFHCDIVFFECVSEFSIVVFLHVRCISVSVVGVFNPVWVASFGAVADGVAWCCFVVCGVSRVLGLVW